MVERIKNPMTIRNWGGGVVLPLLGQISREINLPQRLTQTLRAFVLTVTTVLRWKNGLPIRHEIVHLQTNIFYYYGDIRSRCFYIKLFFFLYLASSASCLKVHHLIDYFVTKTIKASLHNSVLMCSSIV